MNQLKFLPFISREYAASMALGAGMIKSGKRQSNFVPEYAGTEIPPESFKKIPKLSKKQKSKLKQRK